MKLSTTTGMFQQSADHPNLYPMLDIVKKCHSVGYNCLDIGWCKHTDPNFILAQDNWEQLVDEIADYSAKEGIEYYQSHTPFIAACCMQYDPNFKKSGFAEYYRELFRRSVIASAKLGVKWQIIHPLTCPEVNFERRASIEANHKYFDEFIEMGIKLGVGTSYENMLPYCKRQHPNKFCQHYDDLIDLVDSYNDPMVSICYDTGHGNQAGLEVGRAIRACGKRLKTLHINDNVYGAEDEHMMPFLGEVDWFAFADALADVGYTGSLNYEAGKMSSPAPSGEIQEMYAKLVYKNAQYLNSLVEKAFEKKASK